MIVETAAAMFLYRIDFVYIFAGECNISRWQVYCKSETYIHVFLSTEGPEYTMECPIVPHSFPFVSFHFVSFRFVVCARSTTSSQSIHTYYLRLF